LKLNNFHDFLRSLINAGCHISDLAAPSLRRVMAGDIQRCELGGTWNLHALEPHLADLQPQLVECALDQRCEWDLRQVQVLDNAGAMLLWRAWGKRRTSHLLLRPEQEQIFGRFDLPPEPPLLSPLHNPLNGVMALGRWGVIAG
jgi:phospholipid/cholesterol/gamma-HCH transport system permease protein